MQELSQENSKIISDRDQCKWWGLHLDTSMSGLGMCRSLPGSTNTFPSTLVQLALSTEGRGRSRCVWLLTVGE